MILQEFFQIAIRKKLYKSIEHLQQDVDAWLETYNNEGPHSGRYCFEIVEQENARSRRTIQRVIWIISVRSNTGL